MTKIIKTSQRLNNPTGLLLKENTNQIFKRIMTSTTTSQETPFTLGKYSKRLLGPTVIESVALLFCLWLY